MEYLKDIEYIKELGCIIMKLKIALSVFIPLFFLSCSSKPPENIETIGFLEMIRTTIIKASELKDNKEEFRDYMEESGKEDSLSAFYKNDTIVIRDLKRDHSDDALLYSNGKGQLVLNKSIYIAKNRKGDFLYSMDNENWYLQNNDPKKGKENINFDFDIDSELSDDKKTLTVEFSWEASMGENPVKENIRNREPVTLGEGQIFDHSDKKLININLKKQSILLPTGTILESRFVLNGNLVNGSIENNEIKIKAEKDLFIYTGDKRYGLSFDNEHWNISIFSFKINSENRMVSTSDSKILIDNSIEVLYKK